MLKVACWDFLIDPFLAGSLGTSDFRQQYPMRAE
jgi:hypothetical protein